MDSWGAAEAAETEPWRSFDTARELWKNRQRDGAIEIWRGIAEREDTESRCVLQAWHFLREAGVTPPDETAHVVLGMIAEVAIDRRQDVLAAYRDGSIRYLNHAGSAIVIEPEMANEDVRAAAAEWFALGGELARVIGTWERSELPKLGRGESRIMLLTPAGPRFGQGPDHQLRREAMGRPFFARATKLMLAVVAVGRNAPSR